MASDSTMYVTTWGTSGPRVVMVHGSAQGTDYGGDRHFAVQERLAERGWQLVVPDRPGHGRTPSPGRPDDAELDGELVAELLGEGAHLVGHSFGGAVALAAAARRPSAVRSLTLIEPAMALLAMAHPAVREQGMAMRELYTTAKSPIDVVVGFGKLVRIPPEVRGAGNPATLERMGQGLLQLKLPTPDILTKELERIKVAGIPLLVVSGGWSPAFEATCDEVARVGDGRRVVIASEHHFPNLVSDEFNEVLAEFMTAVDAKFSGAT
jgi:pimeloyl-ACP methyl ester carboxylesterase